MLKLGNILKGTILKGTLLDPAGGGGVLMPADPDDIIQWLSGGTIAVDSIVASDLIDPLKADPRPDYIQSNCLVYTGADSISVPALTGTEEVTSHDGSCSLSVSAGQINILSSGTVSNILLDNGAHYQASEGFGLPYNVGGSSNAITSVGGGTWDLSDTTLPYNIINGHTPEVLVKATGVPVPPLENEAPLPGGKFWNQETLSVREDPLWTTVFYPPLQPASQKFFGFAGATNAVGFNQAPFKPDGT